VISPPSEPGEQAFPLNPGIAEKSSFDALSGVCSFPWLALWVFLNL